MKTASLQKGDATLIATVDCAVGLGERMRGLLGRSRLGPGRAMHLARCSSIHTFFMGFDLDLIFLTRDMEVCRAARSVGPNRIVLGGLRARSVLEMESGWFPHEALIAGDRVELVPATTSLE